MLEQITSWVAWLLGVDNHRSAYPKKDWAAFATLPGSYTSTVAPEELVDIAQHRRAERINACQGKDPLQALAAYAQDRLVYDAEGRIREAPDNAAYAKTPPDQRLNKFGLAYKTGSPVWMHRHLADMTVDAAIDMYNAKRWTTVVFDGLRTVDSGYLMYRNAKDSWLRDGLLAAPGKSAHNRALAVDSMQFDAQGREVPMGGHFDHTDMKTNHRDYSGPGISDDAKENRLIRERAFLRAALRRGTLIAPLNEEFWDDRVPGSEKDLGRVMDSLCRATGQSRPAERAHDYAGFAAQWETHLDKEKMRAVFGDVTLPPPENIVYHECLKPIYDRDLPPHMRQAIVSPETLPSTGAARAA